MGKQKLKDARKKRMTERAEIPLIIDTYDDIFSDFDPRPFSERALSDDFLHEAKNASKDKEDGIELIFLIPAKERDLRDEALIKKRLMAHFNRHFNLLKGSKAHLIYNHGLLFTLFGVLTMLIATYLMFTKDSKTFIFSFLIILLEPAGWFLFWEGLNMVLFEPKKIDPDLEFYEKMSKCTISFTSTK